EQRKQRWQEKVRRARKPETRERYKAKVEELGRKITETEALLRVSASRQRLRAAGEEARLRREAAEKRTRAKALEAEGRRAAQEHFANARELRASAHELYKALKHYTRPGQKVSIT